MENAEWLERVKRVNQFLLEYTEEGEGFSVGYNTLKYHYFAWCKSLGLRHSFSAGITRFPLGTTFDAREIGHVLIERGLWHIETRIVSGVRMKHPVGLPRYYGNRKSISNKTREAVYAKLEANGNMCTLCNRPIEASDTVHIDHILPVYRGGTDDPSNLQVVHAKCNRSKWFGQEIEHSAEWYARQQKAMDEATTPHAQIRRGLQARKGNNHVVEK